jgi:hypothetical protein
MRTVFGQNNTTHRLFKKKKETLMIRYNQYRGLTVRRVDKKNESNIQALFLA